MLDRPALCVITDEGLSRERLVEVVAQACEAGCSAVQLRDRRLPARALLALAGELREVTRARSVALLINDRIDVALAVGADGVHLPAAGMSPDRARRLVGPTRMLGRSVHAIREIRALADAPLDYLQFGPVFATPSKAAYGPPQGLERLALAIDAAGAHPVIAVGGLEPERVAAVLERGAAGVAVIGHVMHSQRPGEATTALVRALAG